MHEEVRFGFEGLEIWRRAADLSMPLFAMADSLEQHRLFRFAEQLRGATLSVTNNIAEGSGSVSNQDFAHFLKMSRRSVFEVANILLILSRSGHRPPDCGTALPALEAQSKMTLAFMRTLKR